MLIESIHWRNFWLLKNMYQCSLSPFITRNWKNKALISVVKEYVRSWWPKHAKSKLMAWSRQNQDRQSCQSQSQSWHCQSCQRQSRWPYHAKVEVDGPITPKSKSKLTSSIWWPNHAKRRWKIWRHWRFVDDSCHCEKDPLWGCLVLFFRVSQEVRKIKTLSVSVRWCQCVP